mmetsp:Transcript_5664/g.10807  ORF Transcript_5664/g.10807 Transcript_5664/m.10807 type:complete len:255 (-) Transcript_5664:184-948(-)
MTPLFVFGATFAAYYGSFFLLFKTKVFGLTSNNCPVVVPMEMTSCLHSILVSIAMVYLYATYIWSDETFPPERGQKIYSEVKTAAAVLVGYLCADGIAIVWNREEVKQYKFIDFVGQLIHHALFLVLVALNYHQPKFLYAFIVLYLGEMSTVFLSLRTLFRYYGIEGAMRFLVDLFFAFFFFVTRVFAFGFVVLDVVRSRSVILNTFPVQQQVMFLLLVPLAYCLNLFWAVKVVQGVLKKVKGLMLDSDTKKTH